MLRLWWARAERDSSCIVPRRPLALASLLALTSLFTLTAAPAFGEEIYRQGENGEPPSFPAVGAPYGIAIDQASGDMYVALGGGTIEKFNSAGAA